MNIFQLPPPGVLPPGSVSLDGAAASQFSTSSFADLPKQVHRVDFNLIMRALGLKSDNIHKLGLLRFNI